ncbi:MAG: hypothetical protein DRI57_06400 [Deltaproteobacteria bacterium]|nr:MAG: hypothetical protein DRI57_06400 [Deltaproteobacteria bacterium]
MKSLQNHKRKSCLQQSIHPIKDVRDSEKTHSPIILYLTQRRRGAKEKQGKLATEPFFATLRDFWGNTFFLST